MFLHSALYLMSLPDHISTINHLVVVVLLNDVQFSANIGTSVVDILGIQHIFIHFEMEIHILQRSVSMPFTAPTKIVLASQ
jgi:hypothetical protein